MPIYRYRNLTTNETFDLEQRITESALTQHPETGDPVKRLIQPVGIAFKGSGFYVNDSRASKSASAKDGSKKDSSKGDKAETKSANGKTETKKAEGSSQKSEGKTAAKTESSRSN